MADHNRQLIEIFSRPLPDDELAETTRKLCSVYLNGVWQTISAKQMDIKLQSGGLNNSLFVVKLAPNVKRIGDEPQTVILRIYRNVTCEGELIQTAISLALAERSLGPALLGVFPGGRIDEFIPSRIVTNKEFLNINVAQRLARIIANIHSLELPISKKPILVDIIQKMLDELKKSFRWISKQKMPATIVKPEVTVNEISLKLLEDELQIAKDCMEKSGSPVVFCNNDIHEGNVLLRQNFQITEKSLNGAQDGVDPLILIDYDYGSYFYRGFDIAHYCMECCLHNENPEYPYYSILPEQWPEKEHRRKYIEAYLDEATKIMKKRDGKKPWNISDLPENRETAVEKLMTEINQFVAIANLFWSIWSFYMAESSGKSEYPFFKYGFERIALYYYWKPEMLKYVAINPYVDNYSLS